MPKEVTEQMLSFKLNFINFYFFHCIKIKKKNRIIKFLVFWGKSFILIFHSIQTIFINGLFESLFRHLSKG